jgi:putative ABC transport system ATP-binding protein
MGFASNNIRVAGVHKSFGTGTARIEALRWVDLDVSPGEVTLLVGPSGSGKTTLLCLLAGLLDLDAGSISLFGTPLESLSAEAKTELRATVMGFVFQQFNLLPTLNAQENVAVPLQIRGQPRRQALSAAAAMLDQVGLGSRLKARTTDLSGGEQQRVAIARALVAAPRLLLCDEPTASLDGDTGAKVMTVLRNTALREDRSIIVVTHDSRIFGFGDRMARMSDGRITSVERVVNEKRP